MVRSFSSENFGGNGGLWQGLLEMRKMGATKGGRKTYNK
jgi:hypothetical protein